MLLQDGDRVNPSEELRLGHSASQAHEPFLKIRSSDRDPSLIECWVIAQPLDQLAEFCSLLLDLVHQSNFVLVEFSVAFDFAMLVIHVTSPCVGEGAIVYTRMNAYDENGENGENGETW
jgi:hypothetical protein